jgi:predicted TIM-barrel fold metal-dependent hydrolase
MHWGDYNKNGGPLYYWIDDPYFDPSFAKMEEIGMPLTSLHLEGGWIEPGTGPAKQRAALVRVMERHPNLVVVHAHKGAQRWTNLAEHADIFDRFPNYHRDISTTIQHTYKEDYNALRNFFIKYADRLLYGTDKMEIGDADVSRIARLYCSQFEFYETDNMVKTGYCGVTDDKTPEYSKGLNLPREVLEKIYYKNALRVYPQLVPYLSNVGYSDLVSDLHKIK